MFLQCKTDSEMSGCSQVKSHTCARFVAKDLAKAPISSPTAESTAATGHSAAPSVSIASSAGLTYSATKSHSVAMETFILKIELHKVMPKVCEITFYIISNHLEYSARTER